MAVRIIDWKSERDEFGKIAAASLRCPSCGNRTWTGAHTISDAGTVKPAIACDHECGWIEHVQLAGWCHGPIPVRAAPRVG